MCLENSICNIKKVAGYRKCYFAFQNMAEMGEVGGWGSLSLIFFMKALAAFEYIFFNNMQPLLHLRKTRMKCSLRYFALNCNFFISFSLETGLF